MTLVNIGAPRKHQMITHHGQIEFIFRVQGHNQGSTYANQSMSLTTLLESRLTNMRRFQ